MIRKRIPLTKKEFAEAIKLLVREEGATTEELEAVTHRPSLECHFTLRQHLAKYAPSWAFISERTARGKHGNCRVYKLR